MLFRNGTHLIDAICFFADADPLTISGLLDDEHRNYPPFYSGDGGRDPASDPGGSALITFTNGVRAFVNASKGTPETFELDVFGETGRIRVGNTLAEICRYNEHVAATTQLPRIYTIRSHIFAAINELIQLVEHGGTPTSSGADGRRVLSILLGFLQSNAGNGIPITFPVVDIAVTRPME